MNILKKFAGIKAFVFDVDGVLTDGTIALSSDGEMVRTMHTRDGYALQLAVKQGLEVIVISGAVSSHVKIRLEKLGVHHVYMGTKDKLSKLKEVLHDTGLKAADLLFMGDDVPDIEAMQFCGFACAPKDACTDVLEIADYISPVPGGKGCVRDVIEKVMRLQDSWYFHPEIGSK